MDSSRPLPSTGPPISGPAIVGIALNWWLYGILTMQYYIYINYTGTGRDSKLLRGIVHFLFLLDTVQTILTMVDAFYWYVYNFGDYSKLFDLNTASVNSPLMDAIIAFMVQLVYCWRVWVLGRWRVIPIVTAFLAFVACVNGIFIGIHDAIIASVLKSSPQFRLPVYLWLFASAVTDISIATSMTYLLWDFKSRNVHRDTAAIIKRILLLTLETNTVTTAVSIAIIVMFLDKAIAPPKTNVFLAGGYLLGKLYSNCFMVLLNQRLANEGSSRSRQNTTIDSVTTSDIRIVNRISTVRHSHGVHQHLDFGSEVSVMQFSDPSITDAPPHGLLDTVQMDDMGKGDKMKSSAETFA